MPRPNWSLGMVVPLTEPWTRPADTCRALLGRGIGVPLQQGPTCVPVSSPMPHPAWLTGNYSPELTCRVSITWSWKRVPAAEVSPDLWYWNVWPSRSVGRCSISWNNCALSKSSDPHCRPFQIQIARILPSSLPPSAFILLFKLEHTLAMRCDGYWR